MAVDINTRYFMYSREHHDKINDLEAKAGNKRKLGKVFINGTTKQYTAIVRNPNEYAKLYSDAITIVTGDIRKINYTEGE